MGEVCCKRTRQSKSRGVWYICFLLVKNYGKFPEWSFWSKENNNTSAGGTIFGPKMEHQRRRDFQVLWTRQTDQELRTSHQATRTEKKAQVSGQKVGLKFAKNHNSKKPSALINCVIWKQLCGVGDPWPCGYISLPSVQYCHEHKPNPNPPLLAINQVRTKVKPPPWKVPFPHGKCHPPWKVPPHRGIGQLQTENLLWKAITLKCKAKWALFWAKNTDVYIRKKEESWCLNESCW